MKFTEIEHLSHPRHLLKLTPLKEPYYCNGCKELGFELCYQCPKKACNFHLHEECGKPPISSIHPFFKTCKFYFYAQAPTTFDTTEIFCCDGCGKDILGYIYRCGHDKPHYLHPCCVKLPHSLTGGGVQLRLMKTVSKRCFKCKNKNVAQGISGWSYVSTCGEFCYHIACFKDMILDNWKRTFLGDTRQVDTSLALVTTVSSQDLVLVKGESSRQIRKLMKYAAMVNIALKLIISAIFGNPVSGLSAVAESLAFVKEG